MRFVPVIAAALAMVSCSEAKTQAGEEAQVVAPANADAWVLDKGASRVTFKGVQQGAEFEGRFSSFDAVIILDPDNLDAASISATIDMSSVDAGDGERNSSLPTKDWFYVKKYPQATFSSDRITNTGPDMYEAAGVLMIKDIAKEITLPFRLTVSEGVADATGVLTLVRTDYGVGQGAFATDEWIDLNVEVQVDLRATRP